MKTIFWKQVSVLTAAALMTGLSHAQESSLRQHLEKEGFKFIQQIEAPAQMTGWAGHMDQNPATVFISNDQKYYIVGDLYDKNGKNLTLPALEKHVKGPVLDEVWKSLEKSSWIQDGNSKAPQVVYVFADPNCPYCHTFWKKARPAVDAGKLQLRHIMVGVIRPKSKGQAAALLSSKNPEQVFKDFNQSGGKKPITGLKNIPPALSAKLDQNAMLMEKYGFFATPGMVWKDSHGNFKSHQGALQDLKVIFE